MNIVIIRAFLKLRAALFSVVIKDIENLAEGVQNEF